MPSPGPVDRKIAFLGSTGVGKSSLVFQFVHCQFPDNYEPTIEDDHNKNNYPFLGRTYNVHILDTAGQNNEFSLFPRSCTLNIHGYVLVYAINDRQSFTLTKVIYDKILNAVGGNTGTVPIVLVGNKLDLRHMERQVPTEEGKKLADEWCGGFVETSAKEAIQIEDIFKKALYQIEKAQGNIRQEKSSCDIS